jgi:iron complex outermembrane recepter protein
MKKISLLSLLHFCFTICYSQIGTADSTRTLDSVTVKAFEQYKLPYHSTVSVSTITVSISDYFSKTSLVNGLNSISGVRMEERSPGSYRINIRGSSLRSPFGVRNIKVYWNDIPVTDPGGNTYFNQFSWNNFSAAEVFKGPASSMYGAGTGGLILLKNFEGPWQPGASAEYATGSYNLQNLFTSVRFGRKENKNQITYAHNAADGYRIQTNLRRDNFSWISQVIRDRYQLTASLLYTDMYYQTPGALTLSELNTNPRAARPAAGGFPGAVNAKAAIYQKNMLAGFNLITLLGPGFKNTTTLYGAYAQIKNPAIRNYERRMEPSFGGRTVFRFSKRIKKTTLLLLSGAEFQQGYFNTTVSKNRNGNPDSLLTDDDIKNAALSLFLSVSADINNEWHFTGSISTNKTKLAFTRLNSYPVTTQSRDYKNELAPNISVMKEFGSRFHWLVSVSRGFSPPTVAEVLPSTGVISTDLEAEQGWNYETTFRGFLLAKKQLKLELTGFYFKLNNALVQRRDLSGADFFVNAGGLREKGIEFHTDYNQHIAGNIIQNFSVKTDLTFNHFRYGSFVKGTDNFSGKRLPSVPSTVISLLADVYSHQGFYFRVSYYNASFIYMNDANTAKARPYHLLGSQLGWKKKIRSSYWLNIYAGADNLLDETYSLGNDINAAANRFYNAAPKRNYYAGLSFQWIKANKSN